MKRGGHQIYVGPLGRYSCHLIKYFESLPGVSKIKEAYNPPTSMLEVTATSQKITLGVDFADLYKKSDLYKRNKALITQLSTPQKPSTFTECSCYPAATTFWLPILPATMVLRVNINQIEPATRDWICKVQIVDIARPRESLDKKCTFQNLILEDEEECQIKAVMYADEIQHNHLLHFSTHIINYHQSIIIVLTLLSLYSYTLRNNQFLLTLWKDFGEIEGHEIASKMATEADLPVILGRSIGISTYQGLSLQTRYNSTLRVNPNYPQAVALINWYLHLLFILQLYFACTKPTKRIIYSNNRAKENRTTLLSCPSEKTSTSSSISPMIVIPPANNFSLLQKSRQHLL
ncbi:hypothetical protein H5410_064235 [Solanum commersonii]|uniref:Uncharacterized protein n=1 Tax=Solanum commersonii TaxID=4109 RepID=A0A9J5W079_SOLCO|nr:hypothetical protein H5410_064235 [Solanum commersonii]